MRKIAAILILLAVLISFSQTSLAGDWDTTTNPPNIFYNGGNVGVNTIYFNNSEDAFIESSDMVMKIFPGFNLVIRPISGDHSVQIKPFYPICGSECDVKIQLHPSGVSYFNGGSVGIGTTIPDEMLTVKGKIHAEEVKIDLNIPMPDYVFEKNYELPSLEDIEAHIKAKKHLPDIPTAAEVKEDGIPLGQMQVKLLKKIEELTLYAIEQNKDLSAQNKEIAKLHQENSRLEQRLADIEKRLITVK